MRKIRLTRSWLALAAFATIVACAKLDLGGGGSGPIPTPSSTTSPTSGPTPGVCGTPSTNANLVIVAMGNDIGPNRVAKYGTINGYSVVENASFATQAMLINQWLSQGVLMSITSKNVLQFTNIDSGGALHSAVGFKGAFPPVPHTFPSAAASPTATAVSNSNLWSTGRIEAPLSQQCFSQSFSLSPGVYYFGDLDYYDLSNFRDVLIVASPTPAV